MLHSKSVVLSKFGVLSIVGVTGGGGGVTENSKIMFHISPAILQTTNLNC